jgi:hypothetical protein
MRDAVWPGKCADDSIQNDAAKRIVAMEKALKGLYLVSRDRAGRGTFCTLSCNDKTWDEISAILAERSS